MAVDVLTGASSAVCMLFAHGTTLTFAAKLHPLRWYLSNSGYNSLLIKSKKRWFSYWLELTCSPYPPTPSSCGQVSFTHSIITCFYRQGSHTLFYKWRAFIMCLMQGHTKAECIQTAFHSPLNKSIVHLLSRFVTRYHKKIQSLTLRNPTGKTVAV